MTVELLITLTGAILLGLAAANIHPPRIHFGWAGLTLIAVATLILPAV